MTDLAKAGEHVLGQQGDEKHLARRIKAIPTSLKNNKPVAGESPARVGPRKRRQPERAPTQRGEGAMAVPPLQAFASACLALRLAPATSRPRRRRRIS